MLKLFYFNTKIPLIRKKLWDQSLNCYFVAANNDKLEPYVDYYIENFIPENSNKINLKTDTEIVKPIFFVILQIILINNRNKDKKIKELLSFLLLIINSTITLNLERSIMNPLIFCNYHALMMLFNEEENSMFHEKNKEVKQVYNKFMNKINTKYFLYFYSQEPELLESLKKELFRCMPEILTEVNHFFINNQVTIENQQETYSNLFDVYYKKYILKI